MQSAAEKRGYIVETWSGMRHRDDSSSARLSPQYGRGSHRDEKETEQTAERCGESPALHDMKERAGLPLLRSLQRGGAVESLCLSTLGKQRQKRFLRRDLRAIKQKRLTQRNCSLAELYDTTLAIQRNNLKLRIRPLQKAMCGRSDVIGIDWIWLPCKFEGTPKTLLH